MWRAFQSLVFPPINKGGYTQMRHNEIRDTIASRMKEVCYDVEIEPKLQPLQGECNGCLPLSCAEA